MYEMTLEEFYNELQNKLTDLENFKNGEILTPDNLLPIYLRLPQAERELKNKKGAEKK